MQKIRFKEKGLKIKIFLFFAMPFSLFLIVGLRFANPTYTALLKFSFHEKRAYLFFHGLNRQSLFLGYKHGLCHVLHRALEIAFRDHLLGFLNEPDFRIGEEFL